MRWIVAGLAGLAAMRAARSLVSRGRALDVVQTDELAEKILHRPAPGLSLAIQIGYGLACAGALSAIVDRPRARTGAGFGVALWLLGTELSARLLGLTTPRSAGPHVESLVEHVCFGVATALALRKPDTLRHGRTR